MHNHQLKKTIAVCSALAASLSLTQAALTLTLQEGAGPITTITDGGVGDTIAASGAVGFNGAIGLWNINVTTGLANKSAGFMDLSSLNASSTGAGVLTINLTQDGFTQAGPAEALIGGTLAGGSSRPGSIVYTPMVNSSPILISPLTFTGRGAFALGGAGMVTASAPFSLAERITLTHQGPAVSSFNAELTVVPEPATILAGALLFLPFGASAIRGLRRNHRT